MFPMPTAVRRGLRGTVTVVALAAAGVLVAAGPALAHVTVRPESHSKGATDGTLTFRVPNEEDNAATTQVQMFLPTGHAIPGVLVTSVPGWTAQVGTEKLKTPTKTDGGTITEAVSRVTRTDSKPPRCSSMASASGPSGRWPPPRERFCQKIERRTCPERLLKAKVFSSPTGLPNCRGGPSAFGVQRLRSRRVLPGR
jgi:hypothetical protein